MGKNKITDQLCGLANSFFKDEFFVDSVLLK
jgi:hypothetical protein